MIEEYAEDVIKYYNLCEIVAMAKQKDLSLYGSKKDIAMRIADYNINVFPKVWRGK